MRETLASTAAGCFDALAVPNVTPTHPTHIVMSKDIDRHQGREQRAIIQVRNRSRSSRRGPQRSPRWRLPRLLALLWLWGAVASPGAIAGTETGTGVDLSTPLTLQQALGFAKGHPRARTNDGALLFPRRQPLFLGCHRFAFSDTGGRDANRDIAWSGLLAAEDQQRLEIMQRFFDVLLADLSFSRDSEAMAVAYVQFDRAAARAELGQFSPLAVAELEAAYQLIRRQRAASEAAQLITRSLLAQAMALPADLPRDLVTPELEAPKSAPPELDTVVAEAMLWNTRIKQLLAERTDAERALVEMEVRQQALELLARLNLLKVIAEQARAESDWRDLKLDESRTLYELEAKADLGFSMSQQTKARRDQEEVGLCTALTLAELEALQGHPPPSVDPIGQASEIDG